MNAQEIEDSVDSLRAQCLYVVPREFDYFEATQGPWSPVTPRFADLTSHQVRDYCEKHRILWKDLWDEDSEDWIDEIQMDDRFDGHISEDDRYVPVQTTFYPLIDFDPSESSNLQLALRGETTLVSLGEEDPEEYGFGLTGAGEDLTWDLISAYVTTGYLPPLALIRQIPRGLKPSAHLKPALLYAACEKAIAYVERDTMWAMEALQSCQNV